MEMRHGMPVWAPTEVDMREIRRAVSRERAKAAADLFRSVKALFAGGQDEARFERAVVDGGCIHRS